MAIREYRHLIDQAKTRHSHVNGVVEAANGAINNLQ